jgi:hypothetical protein
LLVAGRVRRPAQRYAHHRSRAAPALAITAARRARSILRGDCAARLG